MWEAPRGSQGVQSAPSSDLVEFLARRVGAVKGERGRFVQFDVVGSVRLPAACGEAAYPRALRAHNHVSLAGGCAITLHDWMIARRALRRHGSKGWGDGSQGEGVGGAGCRPTQRALHSPTRRLPRRETKGTARTGRLIRSFGAGCRCAIRPCCTCRAALCRVPA
jgi:hypothetical protein